MTDKKRGRPRTGERPTKTFKSYTKLSSKEVRILIEDGLDLFIELKRVAFEQKDRRVREILINNEDLKEVLRKWEADKKNE